MQARLMLIALLAFATISPSSLAGEEGRACSLALPPGVRQQLQRKFPQWRPKQVSDLGADDQQLWLKAHAKQCPGVAVGRFKSNSTVSYAFLLLPQSNPTGGYKLVVGSKASANEYDFDLLDHNDNQSSTGMVISKVAPGRYSDFERTESITIKLDSINVEWIEAAAVLYYWSDGRYRTLQTSD